MGVRRATMVAVALILTATTCRSSGAARRVAPTGFGVYVAQVGTAERGTRFVYEVPAPLEDYAVSRLEQFRTKVGAGPVTYLLVGADASRAASDVAVNIGADIEVVTADGRHVRFRAAADVVRDWLNATGSRLAEPVETAGKQLLLDYQLGAITLPGTVGKTVLVADGTLPSVRRIVSGLFGPGAKPVVPRRVSPPRKPPSEIRQR